jgi:hypothetical protein
MHESAVERVVTAYGSTLDEEARNPHSWLENHLERIEGQLAREESMDSYEYHAVLATLLA